MELTRREWFRRMGAAAPMLPYVRVPLQANGPQASAAPIYDLLIAGGRVVDPLLGISDKRDLAIVNGTVARIERGIPVGQARRVVDARGKIVTPGLIDIHGHVYHRGIPTSIDPDLVGLPTGVTTIVDAGSAGASTFAGFRKYVIEPSATRLYALLNIAAIGLVVNNELYLDPRIIDVPAAIRTIEQHRDLILGIKVRINGLAADVAHDAIVLRKARDAANATGLPLMVHWTHEPELLALLEAGDILTHPFNPPPNGQMLDANGRILPQILALRDRGIYTDFAHGNHLKWETAEAAAAQGWYPDTISTDIHAGHVAPRGIVIDLVSTMGKFLYLGLSIDEVVRRVTTNPARLLKFPDAIATLRPGSVADVTILELVEGDVEWKDTPRQTRHGHQRLSMVATFKSGRIVAPA